MCLWGELSVCFKKRGSFRYYYIISFDILLIFCFMQGTCFKLFLQIFVSNFAPIQLYLYNFLELRLFYVVLPKILKFATLILNLLVLQELFLCLKFYLKKLDLDRYSPTVVGSFYSLMVNKCFSGDGDRSHKNQRIKRVKKW